MKKNIIPKAKKIIVSERSESLEHNPLTGRHGRIFRYKEIISLDNPNSLIDDLSKYFAERWNVKSEGLSTIKITETEMSYRNRSRYFFVEIDRSKEFSYHSFNPTAHIHVRITQ